LTAYAVAGYPADCVAFGVLGLLNDNPPDLVVSGINGGPNLGIEGWFGSGTVGAARTAAFLGIPAIAVSGLDDDDDDMVAKVSRWVVQLSASTIVRNLEPGQYLTVAIPELPADAIRGIRFAPRMPMVQSIDFTRVLNEEDGDESQEVWVAKPASMNPDVPPDSDGPIYRQGYIVVTPMRLGEVDSAAIPTFRSQLGSLPSWPEKR
jgi:5'-nucleotidase